MLLAKCVLKWSFCVGFAATLQTGATSGASISVVFASAEAPADERAELKLCENSAVYP